MYQASCGSGEITLCPTLSVDDPSGKGDSCQGNPVGSKYKTRKLLGGAEGREKKGEKEKGVYSIYSQSGLSWVRQTRLTPVQVLAMLLTCCGSPEQVYGFV